MADDTEDESDKKTQYGGTEDEQPETSIDEDDDEE